MRLKQNLGRSNEATEHTTAKEVLQFSVVRIFVQVMMHFSLFMRHSTIWYNLKLFQKVRLLFSITECWLLHFKKPYIQGFFSTLLLLLLNCHNFCRDPLFIFYWCYNSFGWSRCQKGKKTIKNAAAVFKGTCKCDKSSWKFFLILESEIAALHGCLVQRHIEGSSRHSVASEMNCKCIEISFGSLVIAVQAPKSAWNCCNDDSLKSCIYWQAQFRIRNQFLASWVASIISGLNAQKTTSGVLNTIQWRMRWSLAPSIFTSTHITPLGAVILYGEFKDMRL